MRPTLRIAIALEKTLRSPFWFGFWVTVILWMIASTNLFKLTDFGRNTSLDALTKLYPYESLYPDNSAFFVFVNIDDNSLKTLGLNLLTRLVTLAQPSLVSMFYLLKETAFLLTI